MPAGKNLPKLFLNESTWEFEITQGTLSACKWGIWRFLKAKKELKYVLKFLYLLSQINSLISQWFFFIFFPFIFISWRLITLQYYSGFCHNWHESAMDLHVFPIPIPPPTSLSTRSLWVFPVHQPRALVSCIQPGLVICVTLDNIHVSMLFS